jgi:Zn-dependent protease with chaperone function
LLLLAAAPGATLLALAWWMLRRLSVVHGMALMREQLGLRAPRAHDLEEAQLGNVVEEMALAAGMPAPALALIDSATCNVAVFGERAGATLVVTRGVLDTLGRAPTQALVGQALAALANGDGTLAVRMLRLVEMCGLLMLLAQAPLNPDARRALAALLPWRRAEGMATLRHALGDPFSIGMPKGTSNTSSKLTWREWALMPLMGSVMIGVILVPVGVLFALAPLLGFIWRRRRLLADAAAVQFTRDPQALAEAYAALATRDTTLPIKAPWLVNLFALDVIAGVSTLRVASPYPSLRTRIERLNALGARVEPPVVATMNPLWWLLIVPLAAAMLALVGLLMVLGTFVSVALNLLFLGLPAGALHVLLRHLAGS